jgi:hypothetical protein
MPGERVGLIVDNLVEEAGGANNQLEAADCRHCSSA